MRVRLALAPLPAVIQQSRPRHYRGGSRHRTRDGRIPHFLHTAVVVVANIAFVVVVIIVSIFEASESPSTKNKSKCPNWML